MTVHAAKAAPLFIGGDKQKHTGAINKEHGATGGIGLASAFGGENVKLGKKQQQPLAVSAFNVQQPKTNC